MCSDTERLEMLIVLYMCSFLTSYDSRDMSLGDIETIVSYNQSREMYCDLSEIMKYTQSFLAVKGYSETSMFWVNLVFVNSPCWVFVSSPIGFLNASQVDKLLPSLNPENLWKFYIFPVESRRPHHGTETGCSYIYSCVGARMVSDMWTLFLISKFIKWSHTLNFVTFETDY